jgi:hypothetical protein
MSHDGPRYSDNREKPGAYDPRRRRRWTMPPQPRLPEIPRAVGWLLLLFALVAIAIIVLLVLTVFGN